MTENDALENDTESAISKAEALHGAAHAVAFIHNELTFHSITRWSDGLCEIKLPFGSDDANVNARIALAGPSIGLFENLHETNDDLHDNVETVGNTIYGWADDMTNTQHGDASDLGMTNALVEQEAVGAFAFVLANMDLIHRITDQVMIGGGELSYRAVQAARGNTIEPSSEDATESNLVFAGESKMLQRVDRAIRDHLNRQQSI